MTTGLFGGVGSPNPALNCVVCHGVASGAWLILCPLGSRVWLDNSRIRMVAVGNLSLSSLT